MKYILCSLIIAGLTACGASGGGESKAENGTREETLRKVTTPADCQGGVTATQLEGRWNTLLRSESMSILMTFAFDRSGSLSLTSTCSFPTGDLQATVEGRYTSHGGTIMIPYSDSKTERRGDQSCSAGLQKGSIQYAFENRCLVLTDPNGEKLYLTPTY